MFPLATLWRRETSGEKCKYDEQIAILVLKTWKAVFQKTSNDSVLA